MEIRFYVCVCLCTYKTDKMLWQKVRKRLLIKRDEPTVCRCIMTIFQGLFHEIFCLFSVERRSMVPNLLYVIAPFQIDFTVNLQTFLNSEPICGLLRESIFSSELKQI